MKNKLLVIVFVLFFPFSAHCQWAVIDVNSIAASIENGITMYHQLQTAYNQYQNMIERLNKIKQDMKKFDVSKYDWSQWDSILKMTDHYMTQMDNIENIVNRKSMKIGNLRFSMKDLYTTDLYEKLGNEVEEELNPENITEADKANFYRKHGLSVKHYNKLRALNEQLHETALHTAAQVEVMEKEDEIVLEQISDFKAATQDTTGTVDNLQLSAKIQAQNLQEAKEISMTVRSMSQQAMQRNMIEATREAANQELLDQQNSHADVQFNNFYKQSGSDKNLIGPKTSRRR